MDNTFDAIKGAMHGKRNDRDFLINLIDAICNYAVANDMSPNETITIIAKNMLMLTEISNFDNWGKE
jgi:hypothetical protein